MELTHGAETPLAVLELRAQEPEEIALRDRPLQIFIAVQLVLLTLGIYLP